MAPARPVPRRVRQTGRSIAAGDRMVRHDRRDAALLEDRHAGGLVAVKHPQDAARFLGKRRVGGCHGEQQDGNPGPPSALLHGSPRSYSRGGPVLCSVGNWREGGTLRFPIVGQRSAICQRICFALCRRQLEHCLLRPRRGHVVREHQRIGSIVVSRSRSFRSQIAGRMGRGCGCPKETVR